MSDAAAPRMQRAINWLEIVDIEQAVKTCRRDIFGDWHRDPWSWPELEWIARDADTVRHLLTRLQSGKHYQSAAVDVAKENFAVRPALVFDIVDRLAYECLVGRESVRLVGDAPHWMYSWRLHRTRPISGEYNSMGYEWKLYRQHMISLSKYYECALATDIVSYFPSIRIGDLIDEVDRRVGTSAVSERLALLLTGWDAMLGRRGLPQRSNASSILANMYLHSIDELLAQRGALDGPFMDVLVPQGAAATRWVDDIWLFSDEDAYLRSVQLELQNALNGLGLQMNLAKTDVYCGDEMIHSVRNLEHSAVEVALTESVPPDHQPLEALVERLCAAPEKANKTTVRFAAVRIRKFGLSALAQQFADTAHRMPHAAAALARLFNRMGMWRQLGEWYCEYARSGWGSIEWSCAQLGLMFPADEQPPPGVVGLFSATLERGCSLSMLATTAQRLAVWAPDDARMLFRSVVDRHHHPQERRILALAAHLAGEERRWIRDVLAQFEENAVTLALLEDTGFGPLPAVADFAGE